MNADQKKKEEARIGPVPLFLAIFSDLFAGHPDSNSYVRAQKCRFLDSDAPTRTPFDFAQGRLHPGAFWLNAASSLGMTPL
jgi:hypothetical protein